ncbi:MAG: EscU/YscU/HrcU family type III secretion system export apparatus switch protein [Acidobacteria bacterium]|nr:EscU/YscU/HrcU family type III secretion system export apparatus switch protein [Acidobacteriota bacterium]
MADPSQRTEQPTQRRLEKARREGQFPASREWVSGLVFLTFVWLLISRAPAALQASRTLMRESIQFAFREAVSPASLQQYTTRVLLSHLFWFLMFGLLLTACGLALHWLTTGFGLAWKKAAPDLNRLNPSDRLRQLPGQNLSALIQALIFLPVLGWFVFRLESEALASALAFPRMSLQAALHSSGAMVASLLWKGAILLAVLGAIDLIRQRRKWMGQLRMSKQEIRDEQKEVEGNPMVRMRIRRLQRELLRRRMMQQVPKATAVIVNPTHFAVAIRYDTESMGAPKVVAKGKNWLALRIRELALKNQVPIVENPPLAQALYKSVDVGQEIPPHLYQAVAEVLAYIFRLLGGRLPGRESI